MASQHVPPRPCFGFFRHGTAATDFLRFGHGSFFCACLPGGGKAAAFGCWLEGPPPLCRFPLWTRSGVCRSPLHPYVGPQRRLPALPLVVVAHPGSPARGVRPASHTVATCFWPLSRCAQIGACTCLAKCPRCAPIPVRHQTVQSPLTVGRTAVSLCLSP